MKIKYVGLKPEETAFSKDTGIVWYPGSSHEIANEAHAKRMLAHPDVFAIDDRNTGDGITLAAGETVAAAPIDSMLAAMTDAEVHAYAKANGIKVHHAIKGEKLRAAVLAGTDAK